MSKEHLLICLVPFLFSLLPFRCPSMIHQPVKAFLCNVTLFLLSSSANWMQFFLVCVCASRLLQIFNWNPYAKTTKHKYTPQ